MSSSKEAMNDQQSAEDICQKVNDLYHAQAAANEGKVDLFELKKNVLVTLGFRGAEHATPEMVPEKMDRALERLIACSLAKHALDLILDSRKQPNSRIRPILVCILDSIRFWIWPNRMRALRVAKYF